MVISVALCTYKGEPFLREQIESILAQTILPHEIIVCDDNSTDHTLEILQKYEAHTSLPQFKITVNTTNMGVVKNFEQALQHCSGDYIFLCDQDDLWKPDKIEATLSYFEANQNIDVVFSNAQLLGLQKGQLWDFSKFSTKARQDWHTYGSLYVFLRYKSICTGAGMAIKGSAKSYLLPIQTNPFQIHDGWIGIAAAHQNRIAYIDQSLFYYRIHSGQWTKKNTSEFDAKKREDIQLKYNYIKYFIDYYKVSDKNVLELYEHYRFRNTLPTDTFKRLYKVTLEMATGRYFKHSNGLKSVIRDLFTYKSSPKITFQPLK